MLLGEVVDRNGTRQDIQLKGSGRTPFSRGGDGRAWLGPVLREYIVSEAMHALGIPTTRALAVVGTGEMVMRETALPGAVLTRVASSHIRVGTFQYFAATQDREALEILVDYTTGRHYPGAQTALDLLREVTRAQAHLVAKWAGAGFIHGVMNTDNTHMGGLTIDYGPCAFMDAYHPEQVFSSIDQKGRYAYDRQHEIIVWNLAQLASSLLPLIDADSERAVTLATGVLDGFSAQYSAAWLQVFGVKFGLPEARGGDSAMMQGFLALMAKQGADFTNSFRALADGDTPPDLAGVAGFDAWYAGWKARTGNGPEVYKTMRAASPVLIPRNHRIEQMIEAAVQGDLAPFKRLHAALKTPFDASPEYTDLRRPPGPAEQVLQTFCGT
jgi:uncharacterized protein YdiU (UPF0061 family)